MVRADIVSLGAPSAGCAAARPSPLALPLAIPLGFQSRIQVGGSGSCFGAPADGWPPRGAISLPQTQQQPQLQLQIGSDDSLLCTDDEESRAEPEGVVALFDIRLVDAQSLEAAARLGLAEEDMRHIAAQRNAPSASSSAFWAEPGAVPTALGAVVVFRLASEAVQCASTDINRVFEDFGARVIPGFFDVYDDVVDGAALSGLASAQREIQKLWGEPHAAIQGKRLASSAPVFPNPAIKRARVVPQVSQSSPVSKADGGLPVAGKTSLPVTVDRREDSHSEASAGVANADRPTTNKAAADADSTPPAAIISPATTSKQPPPPPAAASPRSAAVSEEQRMCTKCSQPINDTVPLSLSPSATIHEFCALRGKRSLSQTDAACITLRHFGRPAIPSALWKMIHDTYQLIPVSHATTAPSNLRKMLLQRRTVFVIKNKEVHLREWNETVPGEQLAAPQGGAGRPLTCASSDAQGVPDDTQLARALSEIHAIRQHDRAMSSPASNKVEMDNQERTDFSDFVAVAGFRALRCIHCNSCFETADEAAQHALDSRRPIAPGVILVFPSGEPLPMPAPFPQHVPQLPEVQGFCCSCCGRAYPGDVPPRRLLEHIAGAISGDRACAARGAECLSGMVQTPNGMTEGIAIAKKHCHLEHINDRVFVFSRQRPVPVHVDQETCTVLERKPRVVARPDTDDLDYQNSTDPTADTVRSELQAIKVAAASQSDATFASFDAPQWDDAGSGIDRSETQAIKASADATTFAPSDLPHSEELPSAPPSPPHQGEDEQSVVADVLPLDRSQLPRTGIEMDVVLLLKSQVHPQPQGRITLRADYSWGVREFLASEPALSISLRRAIAQGQCVVRPHGGKMFAVDAIMGKTLPPFGAAIVIRDL